MNRNVQGVTVQFWKGQAEIIAMAAEKAGLSVPDYFRGPVLRFVASDAAIPLPTFPAFRKRGGDRQVVQAARLLGVAPRDFVEDIVRRAATAVIDASTPKKPLAKTRALRLKLANGAR